MATAILIRRNKKKEIPTPSNTEVAAMQIHRAGVKREKRRKERNLAGSYLQSAIKRRPIKGGDDMKEAAEWSCG